MKAEHTSGWSCARATGEYVLYALYVLLRMCVLYLLFRRPNVGRVERRRGAANYERMKYDTT